MQDQKVHLSSLTNRKVISQESLSFIRRPLEQTSERSTWRNNHDPHSLGTGNREARPRWTADQTRPIQWTATLPAPASGPQSEWGCRSLGWRCSRTSRPGSGREHHQPGRTPRPRSQLWPLRPGLQCSWCTCLQRRPEELPERSRGWRWQPELEQPGDLAVAPTWSRRPCTASDPCSAARSSSKGLPRRSVRSRCCCQ